MTSVVAKLPLGRADSTFCFLAPNTIFFCGIHFNVPFVRFVPFLKEKSNLALKYENHEDKNLEAVDNYKFSIHFVENITTKI